MKILGWIRKGDKAACGGVVVEGCPTDISHGRELTYRGAHLACRKNCSIAEANLFFSLPNGQNVPHHGHVTTGGCPLLSTLNDIDGWGSESGEAIAEKFALDSEGEWVPVFAPLKHEDCDYDQHLILEDQDGQPLEGIPYRFIDARAAIINGTTGADGKTKIVVGNSGETLDCDIAKEPPA